MRPSLVLLCFILAACAGGGDLVTSATAESKPSTPEGAPSLVVAGGCFWCVEADFEKQPGVYEAISGYSGGEKRDATYYNHKGHREVVEVYYDPDSTSYGELVSKFLRSVDVSDPGGQFCDRGFQYSTAIHYRNDDERAIAEVAVADAENILGQEIATKVEPFKFFVTAEENHQDYYKKNPIRYRIYRTNCGRDRRVKAVWGDQALSAKSK
ncbi:MAG: peptide-methionine (S)-S-oxide reductase MsrA [Cyanobacteria bacterium P01_F01_bin.3]